MCGSRSKAAAPSSSSAASAATSPPPKRSSRLSPKNSLPRRCSSMPSLTVVHDRSKSFYPIFERKSELQQQTHYCPGCGHGIVHKLLAEAIDAMGLKDRTILITPVGCSVFGYYYFDVGNVQVAHGRAPAVATAVKRGRPHSIVI